MPGPDIADLFASLPRLTALPSHQFISAENVPEPYHHLLVHDRHMTIAMETFHGCKVNVRVLQSQLDHHSYVRQIVLVRNNDGVVVLGGIVRIQLNMLEKDVQAAILKEDTPLGHVLINNEVLRHIVVTNYVRLDNMNHWPGFHLNSPAYGRLGILYCDHQPAVELFEALPAIDPF